MKKLFTLIFSSFLLLGCEELIEKELPKIALDSNQSKSVTVSAEGQTYDVSFTSTLAWTAEVVYSDGSGGWIDLNTSSGDGGDATAKIKVTVQKNDGEEQRTARLVIKSESVSVEIAYTQETMNPNPGTEQDDVVFFLSGDSAVVSANGATVQVYVMHNVEYECTVSVDWIHEVDLKAAEEKLHTFEVDANTSTESRTAKISFTSNDTCIQFEIIQEGAESEPDPEPDDVVFYLSGDSAVVSANGATVQVYVVHNVEYECAVSVDWIHEVETKAVEEKLHTFEVDANTSTEPRTATISFTSNDTCIQFEIIQEESSEGLVQLERETLIAIYNALDGDNWTNNENWCSDRPLNEWYGVKLDQVDRGRVCYLDLSGNNLKGHIPENISDLSELTQLYIGYNDVYSLPSTIGEMTKISLLELSGNKSKLSLPSEIRNLKNLQYFTFDQPVCEEFYEITSLKYLNWHLGNTPIDIRIFNNTELETLYLYDIIGDIPEELGNLMSLQQLQLRGDFSQTSIPNTIGNCKELQFLSITNSKLAGSIPEELGECVNLTELHLTDNCIIGSLPSSIGNLSNLNYLDISHNNLTGEIPSSIGGCVSLEYLYLNNNALTSTIPESIGSLPLKFIGLSNNRLEGNVPVSLQENDVWYLCWGYISMDNMLNLDQLYIPTPSFEVNSVNGNRINSSEVYRNNEYTLLYYFYPPPHHDYNRITEVKSLYEKYNDKGLEIIGYIHPHYDLSSLLYYIDNEKLLWENIYPVDDNAMFSFPERAKFVTWPYNDVSFMLIDSNGDVVDVGIGSLGPIPLILEKDLGDGVIDLYESSDYSKNGEITTIQKASKGNGINVVLMGDAYSDRQIADGTYAADMQYLYENFFTQEPFKTYKDMFNVYNVNVVSKNEGYGVYNETAFSGFFGEGTLVGGEDDLVFKYAQKVLSDDEIDEALIIVAMNSDAYAGTCYIYNPESVTGTYGSGAAVAYVPKGADQETFAQIIHHEANGHGFAKLADEYSEGVDGEVPYEIVNRTTNQQNNWGWWKNVDFTSDPDQVRWSYFLNDERYANEGLGVFEGGLTYWTGVWRPTEDSIMRYNTGGFNAPSREAIYYRIHKLAYGDSWEYDYEDFVEYDAVNCSTSSPAPQKARRNYVEKPLEPTAAPVVVGKSWRDAK